MTHRYGLSRAELERMSIELEAETGYDSIRTVATYGPKCIVPGCEFRRSDGEALWEHEHFSRAHGLSFGVPLAELIEQRRTGRPLP